MKGCGSWLFARNDGTKREYCSVTTNVMGVRFYKGIEKLQTMQNVRLRREHGNPHDPHSVLVVLKSGEELGHLDSTVAAVLAPVMDSNVHGLLIKS